MIALSGAVASGTGEGARFVALEWFRAAVRDAVGFDPYPGTLNVRLDEAEALAAWRAIRERAGLVLTPPTPGCGGRLIPVRIGDEVAGAVVVPDLTRYGDEVLEVVAAIDLRTRLGLRDGDRVRLRYDGDTAGRP